MTRDGFLQQSNDRRLHADYAGDILLWDIDKTYLDTQFSTIRGLMAIPFQFAIDKRSIPGAAALLRALRRGPGPTSALVPLYFISGSPPELRGVIERKMTLEGVEFDGITFKDQLGLALRGRFRDIKSQIGYKLRALLRYRRELPDRAQWLLFGDDVEDDQEAFLLFGAIIGGLQKQALETLLRAKRVNEGDIEEITELAESISRGADPVERIFIHLESGRPPEPSADPRVVHTRSFLQTAMVLASIGRIREDAVGAVVKDLRLRQVEESTLAGHVADARDRLRVPEAIAQLGRR